MSPKAKAGIQSHQPGRMPAFACFFPNQPQSLNFPVKQYYTQILKPAKDIPIQVTPCLWQTAPYTP